MHGVKREHDLTADAINEKQREEALQVARWKDLLGRLAQVSPDADPEGFLEANSQVLLENPDYYPCWNARKRLLLARFQDSDDEAALKAMIKKELDFNVGTIKRNPKSYFAWYHRRWLLQEAAASKLQHPVDPTHELALCTILLSLDQRNFHCWGYRRFLGDFFAIDPVKEFEYTSKKVYENFSNYSAWHRRAQLIPLLPESERREVIDSEPADQSVWFYLHWLIDVKSESEEERRALIEAELANISELLAIEPEAPLALLAWSQLAMTSGVRQAETKAHLETLCRIDPQRLGYYSDLLQELPGTTTR